MKLHGQTMVLSIARDVSARKRVEEQLRVSQERWQLALQGNSDGLWDWNVQTNEVFFSPRWKEMLGYTENEIGNHLDEWRTRAHPDDLPRTEQVIQDHFAKKTPRFANEHRLRCKDGTYKWVLARGQALWDETGTPVRIVGSLTDIAERKRVEEALRAAEAKYEDLYDNAPDMFTSVTPDGIVVDCNRTRAIATGYTKEEIIDRHVLELCHPDSREAARAALQSFLETGILHDVELQLQRKDGPPLDVSMNMSAVPRGAFSTVGRSCATSPSANRQRRRCERVNGGIVIWWTTAWG